MSLAGIVLVFSHSFKYCISLLCNSLLVKLIALLFYSDLDCVSYLKKNEIWVF